MPFKTCEISFEYPHPQYLKGVSDEFLKNYSSLVLCSLKTFKTHPDYKHLVVFLHLDTDAPPIGFQYFYTYENRNKSRIDCEMWGLFVDGKFRNYGYGTDLIREAANLAYTMDARTYIFRLSMQEIGLKQKMEKKITALQKEEFRDCFFGKPWVGGTITSFNEKLFA